MKQSTLLTVTSLLSILLLSLHLTSDFIHNAGELSLRGLFISVLILVVLLYGTLMLAERRSGHVIMLLGALRSEEHTSELQSHSDLVCRLLLEKKKHQQTIMLSSPKQYNQRTGS